MASPAELASFSPPDPAGAEDLDAWHNLVVEPALEPELPIIDAHHHLWDANGRPASTDLVSVLMFGKRNHMTKEFHAEQLQQTGGHNVVKTVFLEAGQKYDGPREGPGSDVAPIGEVKYMQSIGDATAKDKTQVCAAVVGHANMLLGKDVEPVLREMMKYPNFRGIRHSAAGYWNPDGSPSNVLRTNNTRGPQHMYLDPKFREGIAVLEKLGLSFDAWCYHMQLEEVADLAKAFPKLQIILDHIGGPVGVGPYAGKRMEVFSEEWKPGIAKVAACPNVSVKLGGIMAINGFGLELRAKPPTSQELADIMGPYYRYVIELFGAHRCMFESNFPVDRSCCSYSVLWNAFKRITAGYDAAARAALFAGTAARVYRIDMGGAKL